MKAIEYINNNEEKMVEDIKELVNIPSVLDEETACSGKPFGEAVFEALDCLLGKAAAMGMSTKNYDGFAGEITVGKGEKIIGILGHMDVVSAGEGWESEPFEMKITDGKMYGRGTMDDKGPMVSCLYAMKYLSDEGMIPEGVALRMIAGTDEEENWGCIEHYNRTAGRMPDYSIVPDGNFPIINCEKGLLDVDFSYGLKENTQAVVKVERLYGGIARNVVPSKAYCNLECETEDLANELVAKFEAIDRVYVKKDGKKIELMAQGKGTHAMSPEKGVNAVSVLMAALEQGGENTGIESVYEIYNRYIGMAYNGEKFGCGFEDEVSGKLTFNVGTIELKDGCINFGTSVRYPATLEKEQVVGAMALTCAEAGIEMTIKSEMASLYVDRNSDFINVLMEAYSLVSGDYESEPISLGGATYARTIPNAVAFGPLFPYEEELAHEPNEFLSIDSLKKMTLIYIEALKGLIKMIEK